MKRKVVLMMLIVGLLAAMVPATSAGGYCAQWHTVQHGENLFRISLRYGTTISYLKTLNNLPDANRINAGQQLCISTTSSGGTHYTVQRGDTLFSIARRYGVNMYVLAQHNNITNLNRIYAGQRLIIPDVTIQL